MSALLSRIMLAIFMLPLAALIYLGSFIFLSDYTRRAYTRNWPRRDETMFIYCGIAIGLFVGVYWWLLWRKSVRWTASRNIKTLVAVAVSVLAACTSAFPFLWLDINEDFAYFFGSALAPIFWLILTAFLWRDTPEERRAKVSGKSALVCPTCGYNLTGLTATRCPECGTQFTLDELLATQPAKADAEFGG